MAGVLGWVTRDEWAAMQNARRRRLRASGDAPAPWSPAALFANNEPGFVLPVDPQFLFQNAAGTIPVTASGDPVGLRLDVSRMGGKSLAQFLAGQPEMRAVAAAGTPSGGWTENAGVITAAGTNGLDNVMFPLVTPTVAGRRYLVTIPNTMPALGFYADFGSGTGSQVGNLSSWEKQVILTCTSPSSVIRIGRWSGAPSGSIGPISVKEIPGNHFIQPTDAARPTLQPPGLRFDLADDALTTTLPQAINGDILIAGTKGSIIEPVSYAAGSTFTIGPNTYTGGTPGILSAIGGIVGVLVIDRSLTQVEKDQLIAYYKGKGAKGLLVEGPELVVNPGNPFTVTTGWTTLVSSLSVEDGALRVTKTNTNGQARSSITSSGGGFYKYKATLKGRTTTSSVMFQLGPTAGNITLVNRVVVGSSLPVVSPITVDGVVVSPGSSIHIALYSANATGQYDDWSEVSIRELRPQEDW